MKNDMPEELFMYKNAFHEITHIHHKNASATKYVRADLTEPKSMEDAAIREDADPAQNTPVSDAVPVRTSSTSLPVISPAMQSAIDAQNYIDRPNTGTLLGKSVIDDGLLAEAVDTAKSVIEKLRRVRLGESFIWAENGSNPTRLTVAHLETIITHAIKTREEPVEVTVEWLVEMDYMEKYNAEQLFKAYPNGIKIINPPNNRDEEKI